jgi:hypothetical protein
MLARRGNFEIDAHDLCVIAAPMGCTLKTPPA